MTESKKRLICKICIITISGWLIHLLLSFLGYMYSSDWWRTLPPLGVKIYLTLIPLLKLVPIIAFAVLIWDRLDRITTKKLSIIALVLLFIIVQPFVRINIGSQRPGKAPESEHEKVERVSIFPDKPDGKESLEFRIMEAQSEAQEGLTKRKVVTTGGSVYVGKRALMTNRHIEEVKAVFNERGGGFSILLKLSKQRWSKITRRNSGKRLAIVLEGKVLAAPLVHETITLGSCKIWGPFTRDQAKRIVLGLSPEN